MGDRDSSLQSVPSLCPCYQRSWGGASDTHTAEANGVVIFRLHVLFFGCFDIKGSGKGLGYSHVTMSNHMIPLFWCAVTCRKVGLIHGLRLH